MFDSLQLELKSRTAANRIMQEVNRRKGLLFDLICNRCSGMIDYSILELIDPKTAAELSLRTAIGDDISML